ncbi:unnamed protein product, partial [Mesorhabditis spiculigera]
MSALRESPLIASTRRPAIARHVIYRILHPVKNFLYSIGESILRFVAILILELAHDLAMSIGNIFIDVTESATRLINGITYILLAVLEDDLQNYREFIRDEQAETDEDEPLGDGDTIDLERSGATPGCKYWYNGQCDECAPGTVFNNTDDSMCTRLTLEGAEIESFMIHGQTGAATALAYFGVECPKDRDKNLYVPGICNQRCPQNCRLCHTSKSCYQCEAGYFPALAADGRTPYCLPASVPVDGIQTASPCPENYIRVGSLCQECKAWTPRCVSCVALFYGELDDAELICWRYEDIVQAAALEELEIMVFMRKSRTGSSSSKALSFTPPVREHSLDAFGNLVLSSSSNSRRCNPLDQQERVIVRQNLRPQALLNMRLKRNLEMRKEEAIKRHAKSSKSGSLSIRTTQESYQGTGDATSFSRETGTGETRSRTVPTGTSTPTLPTYEQRPVTQEEVERRRSLMSSDLNDHDFPVHKIAKVMEDDVLVEYHVRQCSTLSGLIDYGLVHDSLWRGAHCMFSEPLGELYDEVCAACPFGWTHGMDPKTCNHITVYTWVDDAMEEVRVELERRGLVTAPVCKSGHFSVPGSPSTGDEHCEKCQPFCEICLPTRDCIRCKLGYLPTYHNRQCAPIRPRLPQENWCPPGHLRVDYRCMPISAWVRHCIRVHPAQHYHVQRKTLPEFYRMRDVRDYATIVQVPMYWNIRWSNEEDTRQVCYVYRNVLHLDGCHADQCQPGFRITEPLPGVRVCTWDGFQKRETADGHLFDYYWASNIDLDEFSIATKALLYMGSPVLLVLYLALQIAITGSSSSTSHHMHFGSASHRYIIRPNLRARARLNMRLKSMMSRNRVTVTATRPTLETSTTQDSHRRETTTTATSTATGTGTRTGTGDDPTTVHHGTDWKTERSDKQTHARSDEPASEPMPEFPTEVTVPPPRQPRTKSSECTAPTKTTTTEKTMLAQIEAAERGSTGPEVSKTGPDTRDPSL